jgi:hypothetical protein
MGYPQSIEGESLLPGGRIMQQGDLLEDDGEIAYY